MTIPKPLAAAAMTASLIMAAPVSAATQTWSRTFLHKGATAVVPFKPSSVHCYTLSGKPLRRFVMPGGAIIGFGLGAPLSAPYRLIYDIQSRRIVAFHGPYYCTAVGYGGRLASKRIHGSWRLSPLKLTTD